MDAYDPSLAPPGFGLENTGVSCFINSLLQALASCTAFTRAVLGNEEYLGATRTGAAVFAFVRDYSRQPLPADISYHSARILGALQADLAERRNRVQLASGMQCAAETLVFLLDMMEPPLSRRETGAERVRQAADSPITQLFMNRFRCSVYCAVCGEVVSTTTDASTTFSLFHFDALKSRPNTPATFSKNIRSYASPVPGYECPTCAKARMAATAKTAQPRPTAHRIYDLTMVPEIMFCMFNLYEGYGGERKPRYFPQRMEIPAIGGGSLSFRQVAQIEHTGTLSGGHYYAYGLRAGGAVYLLNDRSAAPGQFSSTPNTYIVVYQYAGREPMPAGEG